MDNASVTTNPTAPELKRWQKVGNKLFGYRKDYRGTKEHYINAFLREFIRVRWYTNNRPRTEYRRGTLVTIPAPGKVSYWSLTITVLAFLWKLGLKRNLFSIEITGFRSSGFHLTIGIRFKLIKRDLNPQIEISLWD